MTISKVAQRSDSYIFATLLNKLKNIEASSGKKVLNLAAGDVSFPPSSELMRSLSTNALDPSRYKYPGYQANANFEQAIINYYLRRYNVVVSPNQLQPVLGAKEGIASLTLTLCDPGDELLVPDPGYPAYAGAARLFGITVVPYSLPKENNFDFDLGQVVLKITPRTKCIWVNFPSNPTGRLVAREELEKLVEVCIAQKIWIVFDHAYDQIVFDGKRSLSILEIPNASNIAVELGSFSKSYSLAGLRMGWVVGNEVVITALRKIKSQLDSGVSLLLQDLGAHALNKPDENWHMSMISAYEKKQQMVAKLLTSIGVVFEKPQAGLYIWGQVPDDFMDGDAYAEYLLHEKKILVVPGSTYGLQGKKYIRASFAPDLSGIERYL